MRFLHIVLSLFLATTAFAGNVSVKEFGAVGDGATVAADLIFGHDWPFLAIASYLGLEGVGDRMSMDEVPYKWFGPQYVCLACNLQLIFYHSRKGPVLVKFLMNEKETLLRGLTPVQGPYYEWSVVRENLAGWRR